MKKLILLLLFIPLFFSCEQQMSTEELEKEVKQNMIETFKEPTSAGTKISVQKLHLVHKGDNLYKGWADVIIENQPLEIIRVDKIIEYRYSVEVIYDGESFTWELR